MLSKNLCYDNDMTIDELWDRIVEYYLNSRDFNGLPVRVIELSGKELKAKLAYLIKTGDISLVFEEQHPNPYVKCLNPWPIEKQIQTLKSYKDLTHVVAYPEGKRLAKVVKPQRYAGKPYRRIVAKGQPTLGCAFFKLDVLEKFRNDPRYSYRFNDVVGSIYARDEDMGKEEVFIKSVGIAYDEDMNRAVCVFYTDLMDMSKEQQQYWKHFEVTGTYRPHPDFTRSQVYGQFPEKATLAEAITTELKVINELTMDCYGKMLFKYDYSGSSRPRELAFLIRPTAKELNAFIHILDKIISENINKKFFKGLVAPETETVRKDGKIIVSPKGSLTMLEEYIREWFKPAYTKPMDETFETFKKVRRLRTKPAHSIEDDNFDMKYFREQRELFIEAYTAMRFLRLILQNHPKADRRKIPDWLYEGKIGTY